MGAPYHTVMKKAESAVLDLITRLDTGNDLDALQTALGFQVVELQKSRIEIFAVRATPESVGQMPDGSMFTGNFEVEIVVAVVANKGDTNRTQIGNWCGYVEDILMRNDVEEQIAMGDVQDFTIFKPGWRPGDCRRMVSASELRQEYDITIYCKPSGD
jgi:hypothetical protein